MKRKMFSKIISNIAISFFFTAIFVLLFYYILDDKVDKVISLVNMTSVHLVEKKVDKSKKKFAPYEVYINVQMLTEQLKSYIGEVVTINYGVDFAISLSSESTTQIVSLMEV